MLGRASDVKEKSHGWIERGSMEYEIVLEGELGDEWAAWIGSGASGERSRGFTVLRCDVADQAALYGILRKARDSGLPLVSVRRVGDEGR
jgi:hypothetical protein